MFLKLDEIAGKLDQIFLPLEQEGITGMRLLPQKDASALMQAQKSLGVNFPAKFTELLNKFELGEFEICNVSFGSRGDYASELVRLNSVDEFGGKWWQGEERPANLIVFAVGDPWIFCLIARVVRSMRGCLKIKSFAAGALRATLKNFL
ncbi:SMI1/KNR4 family protein [Campylobacter concisus]|uniref:SMI1/KNR4 family protein n=1 Tax=Campylobacter concisus TaxID=199 RepID=UPI00215625B5|nr:SMI1/KNR4 family protein [Campylobacter concisus]